MDAALPLGAEEVHLSVTATAISHFINTEQGDVTCFRCGETGHVRYQCMRFRVRLCHHFQAGACKMGTACLFAHGGAELRTPWKPRCVRVVKHDGKLVCIGCNSQEHTFRKCPLGKDLVYM